MWKDKMRSLRDYIIRHSKIAFPIIVIVAVAVTVSVALNAKNADAKTGENGESSQTQTASSGTAESESSTAIAGTVESSQEAAIPEVALVQNTDGAIYSLAATYYNALANGDVDTIKSLKNYVEDTEEIRIRELSKYIESYPTIEIYTKPGPEANSYIAYVYTKVTFYGYDVEVPGLQTFYICTDESGNLYFNEGEVGEEVLDYIKAINLQDDVVELNNRVNVEYNDVCLNNSKMFEYIAELEAQVSKATGEALAAQITDSGSTEEQQPDGGNSEQGVEITEGEAASQPSEEQPSESAPEQAAQGPYSATATTTVNVRASDSENAEKITKIPGGTSVEVTEQRANGWSKVIFEGQEGFVKSEYLQITGTIEAGSGSTESENASDTNTGESVGSVLAITNVNIRASANESSEKIGVIPGGETAELLSKDNGWCQIRYNGKVGFVKEDFVQ